MRSHHSMSIRLKKFSGPLQHLDNDSSNVGGHCHCHSSFGQAVRQMTSHWTLKYSGIHRVHGWLKVTAGWHVLWLQNKPHQSSNTMLDSWFVLICCVWFCPITVRAITAKHLSLWCPLFKAHSSRIVVVCSDTTLQAKLSYFFFVLLLFFLHFLSLVAFPNKTYMFSLFLIVMNFNI